jgi:cupin fold WbuC family metalloprotein
MSNPNALPNASGDAFRLDEKLIARGIAAAGASARRRIIMPIHRVQEARVQRMLNFLQPGTYIRPHLHPLDHASETICALRGALGFVLFDEAGAVKETMVLREGGLGVVDIEPRVWHGMVALEAGTVLLEMKQGPYDAATDKIFADWAPEEGEASAENYERALAERFAR